MGVFEVVQSDVIEYSSTYIFHFLFLAVPHCFFHSCEVSFRTITWFTSSNSPSIRLSGVEVSSIGEWMTTGPFEIGTGIICDTVTEILDQIIQ